MSSCNLCLLAQKIYFQEQAISKIKQEQSCVCEISSAFQELQGVIEEVTKGLWDKDLEKATGTLPSSLETTIHDFVNAAESENSQLGMSVQSSPFINSSVGFEYSSIFSQVYGQGNFFLFMFKYF